MITQKHNFKVGDKVKRIEGNPHNFTWIRIGDTGEIIYLKGKGLGIKLDKDGITGFYHNPNFFKKLTFKELIKETINDN